MMCFPSLTESSQSIVTDSGTVLPSPTNKSSGTRNAGVIIGIIFGILIALVIVAVLLIVLCYTKRNKNHKVTLNVGNVAVDNDYTSSMRFSTLRDNQMRANEEIYHRNEDNDHEVNNDDHQDPDEKEPIYPASIQKEPPGSDQKEPPGSDQKESPGSNQNQLLNETVKLEIEQDIAGDVGTDTTEKSLLIVSKFSDNTKTIPESSPFSTDLTFSECKTDVTHLPDEMSQNDDDEFTVQSAAPATTAAYSGDALVMGPPIQRVTTTLESTSGSGDYNRSSSDVKAHSSGINPALNFQEKNPNNQNGSTASTAALSIVDSSYESNSSNVKEKEDISDYTSPNEETTPPIKTNT